MGDVFRVQRVDSDDARTRVQRSRGRHRTGSGQFTNLNLESGTSTFPTPDSTGDLPASDVVRDDRTGKLYVSTDFGVLWNNGNDKGNWHVVAGLPHFEVMHLELEPSARVPTCVGTSQCPRVLYAATHSQGIWALNLPGN